MASDLAYFSLALCVFWEAECGLWKANCHLLMLYHIQDVFILHLKVLPETVSFSLSISFVIDTRYDISCNYSVTSVEGL